MGMGQGGKGVQESFSVGINHSHAIKVWVPLDGENFKWITDHAEGENRSKADIFRQLLGEYRRRIENEKTGAK